MGRVRVIVKVRIIRVRKGVIVRVITSFTVDRYRCRCYGLTLLCPAPCGRRLSDFMVSEIIRVFYSIILVFPPPTLHRRQKFSTYILLDSRYIYISLLFALG